MTFDLRTWLDEVDLSNYQQTLEAHGFTIPERIAAMSDNDIDAIKFRPKDRSHFEIERKKLKPNNPCAFFPPHGDPNRPFPSFDPTHLPFPLAVTWQRLQDEMEKQQPISAAWALRDAMEAGIKFTACLAVADVIHASRETDAHIQNVIGLLLKQTGLSLGDWNSLALEALKIELPNKQLSDLKNLFLKGNGKNSDLQVDLATRKPNDKNPTGNFINWRNKVFGHGVFKTEQKYYADETLAWLPTLHTLFSGLATALSDWRLEDGHGNVVFGRNVTLPKNWQAEEHRPDGNISPLRLSHISGLSLRLGPLLSIRNCTSCATPHVFFFDRAKKIGHGEEPQFKSEFLEYFKGHHDSQKPDSEIRDWAARLPAGWEWNRTSLNRDEVDDVMTAEFSAFEDEVITPDDQIEAIEAEFAKFKDSKGYVHLTGQEGTGKSWLVQSMAQNALQRGDAPVLAYFIRAGARTDYRTFVILINDVASEQFKKITQEIQTKVATIADLKEQFTTYIALLMSANQCSNLTVAIDGLDELPDTPENQATITDFLPVADKLPNGCRILLTSREKLFTGLQNDLDTLKKGGRYAHLSLDPTSEATRGLVRKWLTEKGGIQDEAQIDSILRHSGGVFLWARHYARAVQAGALRLSENLPEGREFYRVYLEKLRTRVGVQIYDSVYLPTLLMLTAVQQPVPLSQLVAWGVPQDRMQSALFDLRDFLREVRLPLAWHETIEDTDSLEYRYTLAHGSLRDYFSSDPVISSRLKETHANIVSSLNCAHHKLWHEIANSRADLLKLADDSLLYALKYLPGHLALSGKNGPIDDDFISAAWNSAIDLAKIKPGYWKQSLSLWDACIAALRVNMELTLDKDKTNYLTYDLAAAQKNKSDEMANMFMLNEAKQGYISVIEVCEDRLFEPDWMQLAAECHHGLAHIALEHFHDKAGAAKHYKLAEENYRSLAGKGHEAAKNLVYETRLEATQLLDPHKAIEACTQITNELNDEKTTILYGMALAQRAKWCAKIGELEQARTDFRAAQDVLNNHDPGSHHAEALAHRLVGLTAKNYHVFGHLLNRFK